VVAKKNDSHPLVTNDDKKALSDNLRRKFSNTFDFRARTLSAVIGPLRKSRHLARTNFAVCPLLGRNLSDCETANSPEADFWPAPLKVCFQDTSGLTRQRSRN
jgi:hypothetical protein